MVRLVCATLAALSGCSGLVKSAVQRAWSGLASSSSTPWPSPAVGEKQYAGGEDMLFIAALVTWNQDRVWLAGAERLLYFSSLPPWRFCVRPVHVKP